MKQVYELRYNSEIVGVFPTENKAIRGMVVYTEYLKENNGILVTERPLKLDKYSMIKMSDGNRIYILERDLFPSIVDFKRYLGI